MTSPSQEVVFPELSLERRVCVTANWEALRTAEFVNSRSSFVSSMVRQSFSSKDLPLNSTIHAFFAFDATTSAVGIFVLSMARTDSMFP